MTINNPTRNKTKNLSLLLTILFLSCFFIFTANIVRAYTPPIGIPDPGFGIDEARPSRPVSWESEVPGYYYINYQTGVDTGRVYGTPMAPRKTIANPIPAGSYVEIHGTYDYAQGGVIIMNGVGTNEEWVANTAGPVWVVGENQDNKPVFVRTMLVYGSYVFVDSIKLSDLGKFQVGSATAGRPANHIMLRNSNGQGITTSGSLVSVVGSLSDPVTNIVVYRNTFSDAGDIAANHDQDSHATTVGTNSSNVWFLENTIHNSSGSGAQVGGASSGYESCHHVYYGKNEVYNTRQAGLAVKYASDVVFSQNTLHDIIDTRPLYDISPSPSKGVGFQYAPQRLWILYNTIYNASYGIYGGSTNATPPDWDIYMIGNVIHDINPPAYVGHTYNPNNTWSEAGIMAAGGTHKYIINNTLHNVVAGIYCPSFVSPYYMENNIISNVTFPGAYHVFFDSSAGANIATLKNSILFQAGGGEKIRWGTATVYDLPGLQSATVAGDNSFNIDPQFINATSNNFRLQNTSPAINAGSVSSIISGVYDEFYARYGLSINMDNDGFVRPQGSAWDMGAYEYDAGYVPDSAAPTAPSGLNVL